MSAAAIAVPTVEAQSNRAARAVRIFLTEARYEFVRLLRTRSFSLSVIGFPLVFYTFFGLIMNRDATIGGMTVARYMLGGYAVFGMVGAALFGVGVGLAGDLSAGWLELKRASPMPPVAFLLAKCATAMAFGVIIVSLLVVMGMTLGHVHISLLEYAKILGLTLAGSIPFASMGLVLALVVPMNSAPGIANMIYLPMSFLSGLWVPIKLLPHVLQKAAPIFPTYHLAQLILSVLGYADPGKATQHWSALLGFTLLMLGLARLAWRKREQNS